MNEPTSSRPLRRRMLLPALLVAGLSCLVGTALLLFPDAKTKAVRIAPAPPMTANDPEALGKTHDLQLVATGGESESHTPHDPRVTVRSTTLESPDELDRRRNLKPRIVPPKIQPVPPPGELHRLIVKFADPLEARAGRDGTLTVTGGNIGPISNLSAVADALQLRFLPLQTAPDEALAALRNRAELRTGRQQPDPASLVEVRAPDASPATILAFANALLPLAAVEYAEIESADAPPPPPAADVSPDTPTLVSYQSYRGSSPGIGVDFVWDSYGIRGDSSLRLTDCEYQFNPLHEDLAGLVSLQPGVTAMFANYGDDHGTASAGILAAGDNSYGMRGAAPLCPMNFYPEFATMDCGYTQFRTATITAAIAASSPGDIVMLEMQAMGPNGGYGPAEYSPSVWDAVKTGTDAGVIVIAAAGNGQEDLDGSGWEAYRNRGDSGAIIVGAGSSSRSRLSFSTYGSRVNLQGWGTGVATTGYGSLLTCGDDPDQKYTTTFNGTSSATPIVASAAALVQSVAIQRLGTRLTPAEMRSLLVATGSPQTCYTNSRIGPLPDLTAAVPQLLAAEFTNSDPIGIPDAGGAQPLPSTIHVSGMDGVVSKLRVRIDGLSHTQSRNLDILLVSPAGKVAALISDAGGYYSVSNISLMFDDAASTVIPESSAIVPGRYRLANYGNDAECPPPGAVGPIGSSLAALAADDPNGDWKLYVTDDHAGDSGTIASWSVSFETAPLPKVGFAAETIEVPENAAPVTLTATLSEATTMDVTIPYTITGSATEPADFTRTSNHIVIPAGQTSGSATITLTDDAVRESDETIIATMDPPTHALPDAITAETLTLTITIIDNDTSPRQTYDDWASTTNLPQPGADPAAIPFHDGVSNLLKYAFNLDPSGPDARSLVPATGNTGLPCLTLDESQNPPVIRLEYLRRKDSGLNYTALQMTDPGNGTRTPMTGASTVTDLDSMWERVTTEQPVDSQAPKRFFTVEVILPDPP